MKVIWNQDICSLVAITEKASKKITYIEIYNEKETNPQSATVYTLGFGTFLDAFIEKQVKLELTIKQFVNAGFNAVPGLCRVMIPLNEADIKMESGPTLCEKGLHSMHIEERFRFGFIENSPLFLKKTYPLESIAFINNIQKPIMVRGGSISRFLQYYDEGSTISNIERLKKEIESFRRYIDSLKRLDSQTIINRILQGGKTMQRMELTALC